MKRLGFLLACLLLATAARAEDVRVRAVDAIGMTVSDMDRSVDFYSRILGFTPVELLEKLAALTPRPRINLVLYRGLCRAQHKPCYAQRSIMRSRAEWRGAIVACR